MKNENLVALSFKAEDLFLIGKHEEAITLYKEIETPVSRQIIDYLTEDVPRLVKGNWAYGHQIVEQIFLLDKHNHQNIQFLAQTYLDHCKIEDFSRIRPHLSAEESDKMIRSAAEKFIEQKDFINAEMLFDVLEEKSRLQSYRNVVVQMVENRNVDSKNIASHIVIRFLEKVADVKLIKKYADYLRKETRIESYVYAYNCYLLIRKIEPGIPFKLKEDVIALALSLVRSQDKFSDADMYVKGCMDMIGRNPGTENYPPEILIALADLYIKENKEEAAGYKKALPLLVCAKSFKDIRSRVKHIMQAWKEELFPVADEYYLEAAKLSN